MGAESYSSARYSTTTFPYRPTRYEVRDCHSAINGRRPPGYAVTVCKMGGDTLQSVGDDMELLRTVRLFERKERRRQRRRRKQRRGY